MHDVKEWTGLSLNEMWREPEDRVARRKPSVMLPKRIVGIVFKMQEKYRRNSHTSHCESQEQNVDLLARRSNKLV